MTRPPQRVRVTRPRNAVRPTTVADEIDRQSEVGAIYMRSLMRAQLRLAVVILAILAVGLGALPALAALAPGLGRHQIAGIPLTWLVLGFAVYPVLIALAAVYVRRAERNERIFAAMLDPAAHDPAHDPGHDPGPDPGVPT